MRGRYRALLCLIVFGLGSAALYAGPVNINTADAETLALELTGIGPALAAAIVEDREANGDFSTTQELTRVSGVGARVVELNRMNIFVNDS